MDQDPQSTDLLQRHLRDQLIELGAELPPLERQEDLIGMTVQSLML